MLLLLTSCRDPDRTQRFRSPANSYEYVVETYFGEGPINSDYTRVFVRPIGEQNVRGALVASGDYLTINSVIFVRSDVAIICQSGGRLDRFNPKVRLSKLSFAIHSRMNRQCR